MLVRKLAATVFMLSMPAIAAAQQRPLVTEDPEVVSQGQVLVEVGFENWWEKRYPASGLQGTLLKVPTVGFSFGLGVAELQLDGTPFQRLAITDTFAGPLSHMLMIDNERAVSVDDFTLGTKVRLLTEAPGRPAIGVRFATKLPMASNEQGMGLDTTDFYASVLVAKTVQSLRIVGNAGLGILGDATRGDQQNDVLTYGLSVARALTQASEVVGEINGRISTIDVPPVGTESSSIIRGGLRFTKGRVRIDAGAMIGVLADDPKFGVTAGLTWVVGG